MSGTLEILLIRAWTSFGRGSCYECRTSFDEGIGDVAVGSLSRAADDFYSGLPTR